MTRLRSMVFVSFMLALLSAVVAVQDLAEHFQCTPRMYDSCACNVTGPTTNMLKLCLKRTNQAFVCKPCGKKYQTYLNCSECSVSQCPVCDDKGFRKWIVSHVGTQPGKEHGYFYLPLVKIFPPTPGTYFDPNVTFHLNSVYKMHNITHSPFKRFKINNCGSYLKHLSEEKLILREAIEIIGILLSDAIEIEKKLKMKILSKILEGFIEKVSEKLRMDEILYKLQCNAGLQSKKHKIYRKNSFNVHNGINNTLSNLRFRREIKRTEDNDLFGKTDKAAEMPEKGSTIHLRPRYDRRSTKEDTVKDGAITKHFRTTRKPPAGKKHPPHVRGKKHRKFNKNRKQQNGSRKAKFKSVNMGNGSHPNKALLDKQIASVTSRFDEESGNSSYKESDKVNAIYNTPRNDVSLSDISRDISVISSFSIDMRSTEAPWSPYGLYNKQFSKQTSQNSSSTGVAQLEFRNATLSKEMSESHKDENTTEHDLSSLIQDKQPTEPGWGLKLLTTAENSRKESFLSSNVFRGFSRPNDASYSSGFPTDPNMSSNETTKYREGIKTSKRHDHTAMNTSSITASHTLEEVKWTVYSTENFEFNGVKRTDNFINRSPHATDEQLVNTNSSRTSKGKIVSNEMGMPKHSERKFLVTYSDQSDSNYITGQHLFKNASSGHLIEIGETVKVNSTKTVNNLKDMPLINVLEEQLMHLLASDEDKKDIRNTNSKKPYQTVSTTSSSLREQDSSLNATEYKVPGNKVKRDTIAVNGEKSSDNVADASLLQPIQQRQMVNSSTSIENENHDTESGNSGNLTYLSSHISFTGNGTEEYLTDSTTSEYKVAENQTFGTSRRIESFAIVTSNLPDQQQQNSDSKTFAEVIDIMRAEVNKSGSYRYNETNFRHANFIYSSTNKNDTNQTFLGETPEHTIDKNKTKEENQDETLDETLEKIQNRTESNKFNGIQGNIRTFESTATSNRDNLYGNFSGNENKALSFSYETATESNERNQEDGYKRNHIFDQHKTMLHHFSTGELNTTSSKESISDHVDKLNFRMFKDSEIRKNSSGHFIDDANTDSLLYYRTIKYDDYESSTTVKHDNTTINQNQTTIKNNDNIENGMIESLNLESGHSYVRYKRDQLVSKEVTTNIQNDRKNLNGDFQNKKVLFSFTEELWTPSTVIKQNSVDYRKEKNFRIPKKSDEVLGFTLSSSDSKKDQDLLYNGTTNKIEKTNKGILKSKNIGIKYKNQKAQGMGLYKNGGEFFAMSPNSKKDQRELPKSMKVKQTSDSYSKDTGNKQLNAYWTSSGYEKNHQFSFLSGKRPESTKYNLPTYENEEKDYKQGMSVQQNIDYSFSNNRQEPSLEEIPKDTLLQKTNENANVARNKYINPKFRTGRKFLQFSETDNNKLLVSRDGTLFSLRSRRSLKNLPENNWCTLPDRTYYGKLDCTVWTYQKVCIITCTKDNKVQGSDQTEYKCARKKNVWEPKLQPCVDIGLKALDAAMERKKSDKLQDVTLPSYDYITGDEEYDEYLYKFEDNHLGSDEKDYAYNYLEQAVVA